MAFNKQKTRNVEHVRAVANENRRQTLKDSVEIPWTCVSEIVMQGLEMKRAREKFVRLLPLQEQNECRTVLKSHTVPLTVTQTS